MGNKIRAIIFLAVIAIAAVVWHRLSYSQSAAEGAVPAEVSSQPISQPAAEAQTLSSDSGAEPLASSTGVLRIERVAPDKDAYSMELRDVDLGDFLRILAYRYKLNIVLDKDVSGRVTASFDSISMDEALRAILKTNGYTFKKEGNIIRVSAAMVTEIIKLNYVQVEAVLGISADVTEAKVSTASTSGDSASSTTSSTTSSATGTAGAAASNIYSLLSANGKILAGQDPNTIMVIDYLENIDKIKEYINMIDVQREQVIIDARVVEVTLDDTDYLTSNITWDAGKRWTMNLPYKGLDATGAAPDGTFTWGVVNASVNNVVQALSIHLDTDLLSAPRIATLNKKTAIIDITKELPYLKEDISVESGVTTITKEIQWKYEGIKLEVTPTINPDRTITMFIKPDVSELVAWSRELPEWTSSDPNAPVVDTRSAQTNITVSDGQTIVMGGLVKNKFELNLTKVPLLGDVPILGHLFKSKKYVKVKKELLIFVEPRIISTEEAKKMMLENRYGAGKRHRVLKEHKERKIENEFLKEEYDQEKEKEYRRKQQEKEHGAKALPEETDVAVSGDKEVAVSPEYYEQTKGRHRAENQAFRRAERILKKQENAAERKKLQARKRQAQGEDNLHEGYKYIKGSWEYLEQEEFQKINEGIETIKPE